jgi:hypothetical protein
VVHLIREAGWIPTQRTTQYDVIKVHGEEVGASS